jgi:hypothetical protein
MRRTLGPSLRKRPISSEFEAVNNGSVSVDFSYARPAKPEPMVPDGVPDTATDAAVKAPAGMGCVLVVCTGAAGEAGETLGEGLIGDSNTAHPVSAEVAASPPRISSRRRLVSCG